MKRIFDLVVVVLLLTLLVIPMLLIASVVRVTSEGFVLYWSDRIGQSNVIFRMPKFRTMRSDTPAVATHLMSDPDAFLSPIGGFLRRTSMDELPQLFSILKGDMSFVGPRPALFNQDDLVGLRTFRIRNTVNTDLAYRFRIQCWSSSPDEDLSSSASLDANKRFTTKFQH